MSDIIIQRLMDAIQDAYTDMCIEDIAVEQETKRLDAMVERGEIASYADVYASLSEDGVLTINETILPRYPIANVNVTISFEEPS
jgi:hypothetical protein